MPRARARVNFVAPPINFAAEADHVNLEYDIFMAEVIRQRNAEVIRQRNIANGVIGENDMAKKIDYRKMKIDIAREQGYDITDTFDYDNQNLGAVFWKSKVIQMLLAKDMEKGKSYALEMTGNESFPKGIASDRLSVPYFSWKYSSTGKYTEFQEGLKGTILPDIDLKVAKGAQPSLAIIRYLRKIERYGSSSIMVFDDDYCRIVLEPNRPVVEIKWN